MLEVALGPLTHDAAELEFQCRADGGGPLLPVNLADELSERLLVDAAGFAVGVQDAPVSAQGDEGVRDVL